jgi:hypothetical protein
MRKRSIAFENRAEVGDRDERPQALQVHAACLRIV